MKKAFEYLIDAFKRDYLINRMPIEKSGWRTLMEVVRKAGVTKYSMYGRGGRGGKAFAELTSLDIVESRFFLGERGRGGQVLKIRIRNAMEQIK